MLEPHPVNAVDMSQPSVLMLEIRIHMTVPLTRALKEWETKSSGVIASEARDIGLYGGVVIDGKRLFIKQLDASLATLHECECVMFP